MKLKVAFSENDKLDVRFSENDRSFNADLGEINVIHDGQNGATFYPAVSQDGVISWTNDRDLVNPPPVNIKGVKGDKGDKGDTGEEGYTPVKGIDYYTADEMQVIVDHLFEMIKNNVKPARIGEVTLLASSWTGENNLYSQVVNVDGVTENSQVDLTPDVQQLAVFYDKDITFVTENDDGVVTVYVIGQKPTNDYTIQVTITEVDV